MKHEVPALSGESLTARPRFRSTAGEQLLRWYSIRQTRQRMPQAMQQYADAVPPSLDRLNTMGKKIEAISAPSRKVPELTVCIPIAEESENIKSIARTMDQIVKAQRTFGRSIQVLAWANRIGETAKRQRKPAYAEIVQLLSSYSRPDLSVLAAHDDIATLPPLHRSMSVVRQHMMEGLLSQAIENNYPLTHPVLWLDADTTFIGKDTFNQITTNVVPDAIGVFRPTLDYSVDWLNGDSANFDNATKAFVIDELARRKSWKRFNRTEIEDQYLQECGAYFSLATYLMAGGVDVKTHETGGLLFSIDTLESSCYTKQVKQDYQTALGRPLNIAQSYGIHTPEVRIATSGRRFYWQVRRKGNSGLIEPRANSIERTYETHIDNHHTDDTTETHLEPTRFFAEVHERYGNYLKASELIALSALMRKYFPEEHRSLNANLERSAHLQAAE